MTEFGEKADAYIINTCAITQVADQKSGKAVRGAIKRAPGAVVIVTGCYARTGIDKLRNIPGVRLIVENKDKMSIPDLARDLIGSRVKEAGDAPAYADPRGGGEFADDESDFSAPRADAGTSTDTNAVKGLDRTRGSIILQNGCRQFCSYCVIPHVRDELYDATIEDAMARAASLAARGYIEITLLGINLGAYGMSGVAAPGALDPKRDKEFKDSTEGALMPVRRVPGLAAPGAGKNLADIFRRLLEAFPGTRFRLGSVEPMEVTQELVELIREYPNARKHLHMPLQSGCDRILRLMNRNYTAAEYREKTRMIRALIPDIAITTDIMAGFPGETEDEHRLSMAFAREMAFSQIHVFAYSRRPGTPAALMPGQLKNAVKDRRSGEFISLGKDMRERYGDSWIGRPQEVILEMELEDGSWYGHSDNYMEVIYTPENEAELIHVTDASRNFHDTRALGESRAMPGLQGAVLSLIISGRSPVRKGAWQGKLGRAR